MLYLGGWSTVFSGTWQAVTANENFAWGQVTAPSGDHRQIIATYELPDGSVASPLSYLSMYYDLVDGGGLVYTAIQTKPFGSTTYSTGDFALWWPLMNRMGFPFTFPRRRSEIVATGVSPPHPQKQSPDGFGPSPKWTL